MASTVPNNAKLMAPGGVIFLAPGGEMGPSQRHALVEFKVIGSALVVPPMPRCVLIGKQGVLSIEEHHLTVHSNLMVHVKIDRSTSSVVELAPPAIEHGALSHEVVHVVTVGAAPPGSVRPQTGRFQSKYQGGTGIVSLLPDHNYSRIATHLLVDVWATRSRFNAPAKLPAQWPGARPALTADARAVTGPISSNRVCRNGEGSESDVIFYFRHWYAEVEEFPFAPFIYSVPDSRFSGDEIEAMCWNGADDWEIRGHRARVSFRIGRYEYSLSPDEARRLAEFTSNADRSNVNGVVTVTIPITDVLSIQLPDEDAARVPGFLVSAADYAEEAEATPSATVPRASIETAALTADAHRASSTHANLSSE